MRGALLRTVSAVALTAAAVLWFGSGRIRRRDGKSDSPVQLSGAARGDAKTIDSSALTRQFLLYYIVPLWLSAGVSDWFCHRATHIEVTTGVKEGLCHLLMLAEVSVPVLTALFLRAGQFVDPRQRSAFAAALCRHGTGRHRYFPIIAVSRGIEPHFAGQSWAACPCRRHGKPVKDCAGSQVNQILDPAAPFLPNSNGLMNWRRPRRASTSSARCRSAS